MLKNHSGSFTWLLDQVSAMFNDKANEFSAIRDHPDYDAAMTKLDPILPALQRSEPAAAAWLVLTSSTVWQILRVIETLLPAGARRLASTEDVSEFLYCIASYLLFFQRKAREILPAHSQFGTRPHFLVFQAIHLFENCWSANRSPASSNKEEEPKPTLQQIKIIEYPLVGKKNVVIKIDGFAGSGKTFALSKWRQLTQTSSFSS